MAYTTDKMDDEIVRLLKAGVAGLLPTDTIYGLSARALDAPAVERIHRIKLRDGGKPLIVLIADVKMLDLLSISPKQAKPAEKYWPGALSLEFDAPGSPAWLHRGLGHFAIRMPDHPELLGLINKVGPIVSTSANLQGEPPVRTAEEAIRLFGEQLDFYVDAGKLDNPPSTLAVIENGRLKAVRQGSVFIDN